MADSFIRSSGAEVFNGNPIGLNSKMFTWTYGRLTAAPELPGTFRFPEQMSVGVKAPQLNIQGLFDASVSHATNESASKIDFYFLNELVASSGPKYFKDDYIKPANGSELLVEIIQWNMVMNAKESDSPNVRAPTQNYSINLIVVSGTPLFSGTGIVYK